MLGPFLVKRFHCALLALGSFVETRAFSARRLLIYGLLAL